MRASQRGKPLKMRIRSSQGTEKARAQIAELLADNTVVQSVVLAVNKDDEWTVLARGLSARQFGHVMLIGAEALKAMIAHEDGGPDPGPEVRLRPGTPNKTAGIEVGRAGPKRAPECTHDAEGIITPPPGERFLNCGECGVNRWYVTNNDEAPVARLVCVRCANEVKMIRVTVPEGRA